MTDFATTHLSPGQRWYVTEIRAIHPVRGDLTIFAGPHVPGISAADAQQYCNEYIGYCKVIGELIAEIPFYDDNGVNYDVWNN